MSKFNLPMAGRGWRQARSLQVLYNQINAAAPYRDTQGGPDGNIGDISHQPHNIYHNPNPQGVVCALDITHAPLTGFDSYEFFDLLHNLKDSRIKYLISNRRIVSSSNSPWVVHHYTGSNPHDKHIHISVGRGPDGRSIRPDLYDGTALWDLGLPFAGWHTQIKKPEPPPAPLGRPLHSGKAGWYGQAQGQHVWIDKGDGRWNANKTIFLGPDNALGVPENQQGIALPSRATLGKWFNVRSPRGDTLMARQTDLGPATWTGRTIDIHAVLADKFGYTPTNFPTGAVFHWWAV